MTNEQQTRDDSKAALEKNERDRRRHIRIEIPLKARFLASDGNEHACLVSNISAGGALLRAKQPPQKGADVVIYIDGVGRFEATVVRAGSHSFAVAYKAGDVKLKRTADILTEVVNRGSREADRRIAPRMRHDEPALVTLENGDQTHCAILDISLTGASIEIMPRPTLGAQLTLGRMTAKVVRHHEKGIGVIFTGPAQRMDAVIHQTSHSEPENADTGAGLATGSNRTR